MIQNNKIFVNNLQPESNFVEQFSWQPFKDNNLVHNRIVNKITDSIYFKLGVSISLATTINLLDSNQAVQATDLNELKTLNSLNSQSKIQNFLPRVLNFMPFSTQSFLVKSLGNNIKSLAVLPPSINYQSVKSQPHQNQTRQANQAPPRLLVKQPLRIHTVKRGDTINQIAKTYQVPSQELIQLNQIKNANIIFVGQKLRIPPKAIGGISLDTSKLPATALVSPDSSQITNQRTIQPPLKVSSVVPGQVAEVKTNSSSDNLGDDPYISKLRAEIEQMQAQYRSQNQESRNPGNFTSLGDDDPNTVAPRLEKLAKPATQEQSDISNATVELDISQLSSPGESDFLEEEEVVALSLPPLPSSEEYLPEGFNGYIWPAQGVLTSGYGWRWGRLHRGIDIAAPIGTPILAAATGEVIAAGWHGGYGNLVKLEHIDGSVTLYAHNSKILVSHGQWVSQGEQIAKMGSTGRSTGSHLHFEIHTSDRKVINPLALLNRR
ncbi:MAG: peptidoglycan DD-metalloendopeptidase family protein [Cyanobacteria bacterium J06621_8]